MTAVRRFSLSFDLMAASNRKMELTQVKCGMGTHHKYSYKLNMKYRL
jgi:hypothetical protein